MIRMRKPDQFCARVATTGPQAGGRQVGEVIPDYHTHPCSIDALMAEISGPGTGAPTKMQGSWDMVVEEDRGPAGWVRVGVIRKYPDHRVEYVPAPAPAAS